MVYQFETKKKKAGFFFCCNVFELKINISFVLIL